MAKPLASNNVIWQCPGLSTAEVESLISTPVENALNGLMSLKTIRSKSALGLSSVVLYFDEGTDLMMARLFKGQILFQRFQPVRYDPAREPLNSLAGVTEI